MRSIVGSAATKSSPNNRAASAAAFTDRLTCASGTVSYSSARLLARSSITATALGRAVGTVSSDGRDALESSRGRSSAILRKVTADEHPAVLSEGVRPHPPVHPRRAPQRDHLRRRPAGAVPAGDGGRRPAYRPVVSRPARRRGATGRRPHGGGRCGPATGGAGSPRTGSRDRVRCRGLLRRRGRAHRRVSGGWVAARRGG